MIAIQHAGEGAFGNSRRVVAQLLQSLQPKLAHTLDVDIRQVRRAHHFGKEGDRRLHETRDRRQRQDGGIGTDIDIEIRSKPRDGVGHFQRRSPGAPFIEKIRRERR
jgi:hypothetical protein